MDDQVLVSVDVLRRAHRLAVWATGEACARSHSDADLALEDQRAQLARDLEQAIVEGTSP